MSETCSTKNYRPETRLVQSGTLRSQFDETSEALFLTQGYVYDNSAQAEARFKGEDPGFILSRFPIRRFGCSSPHDRVRRRGGARADRDRHGRGDARSSGHSRPAITWSRRDGSVRVLSLRREDCCRASASSDAGRGLDLDQWRRAVRPNTRSFFMETPDQSDARRARHPGVARDRPQWARRSSSTTSSPPRSGRARFSSAPSRGLFHDQAHRRPGPLSSAAWSRLRHFHLRPHP